MSYYRIPSGSNLMLNVLLDDGNTTKYPQAVVYDSTFTEIAGSPFNLTHVDHGLYSNLAVSVPDGKYTVVYIVYEDPAHTMASTRYSRNLDVFDVTDIVDVNAISEGVWRETRAGNSPAGSFGEILDAKLSLIKADTALVPPAKTNTDTLLARLTSGRATNLDNLNAPISGLPTAVQIADAVWDEATAGHATAGTFGARLDAAVSSRQSEASALARFTALQNDTDDIQVSLATSLTHTNAIKLATDQLTFSGGLVLAQSNVVSDKTGYALSTSGIAAIADGVWDEAMAGHLTAGTTGEKLNNGDSSADIGALADAVWDEARSAHVSAGTFGESLQGVLSTARAAKLDNLDVAVSTRESESSAATRAINDQNEHDATQVLVGNVQSVLGLPFGMNIASDIASVKADTTIINMVLGLPAGASLSDDIAAVKAQTDALETKSDSLLTRIGVPSVDVATDLNTLKAATTAINGKTSQLTFTGANVNAETKVNADKTGYMLQGAQLDTIADRVWDESAAGHVMPGSFGKVVQDTALGVNPVTIAEAVWDEDVASHATAGTFGLLVDVINHTTDHTLSEVTDGASGLGAIKAEVQNQGLLTRIEVNENEAKIDAIIPAIAASQATVISEIDDNETKIDSLSAQLITAKSDIIAEVNQNEVKIDALQGSVSSLSNNTAVRFIVPERMIRPSVGTKAYQFHLRLFDDNGAPVAPLSTPSIRIRRLDTGVDVVSGALMTQDGAKVGAYFFNYTLLTSTFLAPVLIEATIVDENSVTKYIPATTEITEFESDLTSVQAQLTVVEGKVDAIDSEVTSGVHGLSAIRAKQDDIVVEVNQNESLLQLVKTKVDSLPTNIATSPEVGAVLTAVNTKPSLVQFQNTLDLAVDELKGVDDRNLTDVYNSLDISTVVKTNDPRLANLDAPISSRSTLTAAQVWASSTRTLSQYGLDAASIKAVWDYLAADATVVGSLGQQLASKLDAAISTRATSAQVSSELAGVAQESTLSALPSLITTESSENQLLLNQVMALLSQVGSKTVNLPSDPASQSAVLSAVAGLSGVISDINLRTTVIKSKTDGLPADPAREATVAAIPTNPLRTNDVRLNTLSNLDAPVSGAIPADISNLATKADVQSGDAILGGKIDQTKASVEELHLKADAMKVKVDRIPLQPAAIQDVNAARDVVMGELAARGPELSALEVWSYPTREITNDLSQAGPDISNLAEKADLDELARKQYVNRMTTTFSGTTGEQEILAWAEKDGIAVLGEDCIVDVLDSTGQRIWGATVDYPNVDGVFRFTHQWQPLSGRNYYVEISITVDGAERINKQSFYTAG